MGADRPLSQAAFTGDDSLLRPEERPCARPPRDGDVCSVDGIPVTAVGGRDTLVTPAVEASVTGMSTSRTLGAAGSAVPPKRASGTWVVVAYRLRNAGPKPIRYLRTGLRIGDETFDEDAGASAYLPRSGAMPLPPDEEIETEVAFDVPAAVAERAARKGALILPAERATSSATRTSASRRAGCACRRSRTRCRTSRRPPPPISHRRRRARRRSRSSGGTGHRSAAAPGACTRPTRSSRCRRASSPAACGPAPRAGSCVVPPVRDSVRTRLLATVRHDTPRGKGRVTGVPDRMILLADCGGAGRWAIVAWVGRRSEGGPVIFVDEFQWRGGAWHGSPKGRWPGCGIPEAAAAAWQIDISHCARSRDQAPGDVSELTALDDAPEAAVPELVGRDEDHVGDAERHRAGRGPPGPPRPPRTA